MPQTERKDSGLARLRKETPGSAREREILEKAAAWFAQESVGSHKKRSDS